jgi:hypothetical protein
MNDRLLEERIMTAKAFSEIGETKRQFLFLVTGEYLITGFFWVFAALGSLALNDENPHRASMFFFTFFILTLSNGVWEILTGWYADKFKRQFSLSAGFLACLVGFCFMGVAAFVKDDLIKYFVWNTGITIWSLGPALLSGAQEAWLVDRCNFFSQRPPEDVDETFKKSAGYGVLAKSVGAAICFMIFLGPDLLLGRGDSANKRFFLLSASIAAALSAGLLYLSLRLGEEYWDHPKYQTDESLFAFLGKGLEDLWRTPYRWFTLGYVGFMTLNYVQSSTIWSYLEETQRPAQKTDQLDITRLLIWGGVLIAVELTGSLLSRPFAKWIDRIEPHRIRLPIASLIYLAPIPFLGIIGQSLFFRQDSLFHQKGFLYLLIVAAFSFRIAHASVFGSLNTIGQLSIKSDERRAILISMSSAISSFLTSMVFFAFYLSSLHNSRAVTTHIEQFWLLVPLPCIFILAMGGYLVARRREEAN